MGAYFVCAVMVSLSGVCLFALLAYYKPKSGLYSRLLILVILAPIVAIVLAVSASSLAS